MGLANSKLTQSLLVHGIRSSISESFCPIVENAIKFSETTIINLLMMFSMLPKCSI